MSPVVLDHSITKSLRLRLTPSTWSTPFSHIRLLVDVPVLMSLSPTLHIRPSPLSVCRHELAWPPSPLLSTVLVLHTCTSQDKIIHVSQHHTHAMASVEHSHINHVLTIRVTCSLGYWSKTLLLVLIAKAMQFGGCMGWDTATPRIQGKERSKQVRWTVHPWKPGAGMNFEVSSSSCIFCFLVTTNCATLHYPCVPLGLV